MLTSAAMHGASRNMSLVTALTLIGTLAAVPAAAAPASKASGKARPASSPPASSTPASSSPASSSPTSTSTPTSQPATRAASKPIAAPSGLVFPDFKNRSHGSGSIGRPLLWDPAWPKFSTWEWVVSGVAGAAALTFAIIGPRGGPRDGRIGVDESVRSALVASSLGGRRDARDASDILLTTLTSYPLIDAVLVAGWYRRSPGVAAQMALIDMEVFTITIGLTSLAKTVGARRRPYGRVCGVERPPSTRDCDSNDLDYSFFSGHSSTAFAAASVNCAHHIWLGLYGAPWADALSCVAGFSVATATGVLRIVGDQHYFSDVMIGAAVGTLVGFGVPWLFHYRHGTPGKGKPSNSERDSGFRVQLAPMGLGVGALGTF
jgi:membrane-associated phospholipid phosphatase